jgi:hypothetical protein
MEPQTGDVHELFLMLFTANEPAIRAFVRRLVPTRQDAADVMQGVALVLWRKPTAASNCHSIRTDYRDRKARPSEVSGSWLFAVSRCEQTATRTPENDSSASGQHGH